MQWMSFALGFTATSGTTAISLLSIGGENFHGIDNASVTAVPEPRTIILWSVIVGTCLMAVTCRKLFA